MTHSRVGMGRWNGGIRPIRLCEGTSRHGHWPFSVSLCSASVHLSLDIVFRLIF